MYQIKNITDDNPEFSETVAMDYHLDERVQLLNTSIIDPDFNYQMVMTNNHGWLITNIFINRVGNNPPEPAVFYQIKGINDYGTFMDTVKEAFCNICESYPDEFITKACELITKAALDDGVNSSDILEVFTFT